MTDKITLNKLLQEELLSLHKNVVTLPVHSPQLAEHRYGGVYMFKDVDDNVLYVGISDNLYRRISSHLKGYGSTDIYHYNHDKLTVEFFREDHILYRDIYESYLIYTLNPRYNIGKTDRRKLE